MEILSGLNTANTAGVATARITSLVDQENRKVEVVL
jgi:hypothetical protein